jgi:hypothetical protein
MAEREVRIRFVIDDAGTVRVVDMAGNKLAELGAQAERAATRSTSAFTGFRGTVVALNQALDLAERIARGVGRAYEFAFADTARRADDLIKLSRAVGVNVETLSALAPAAQLAGTSIATVGKGLEFFGRQMAEAQDQTTKQAAIFEALKVQVIDTNTGAMRPLVDVFFDTIDALEQLPDSAEKTTARFTLLGRTSREMATFIANGSDELRTLMEEARRTGQVFSTDFAQRAEIVNDTLHRIQQRVQGTANLLAAELIDDVERVANRMLDWADANQQLIATELADWITRAATATTTFASALASIASHVKSIIDAWNSLPEALRTTLAGALVGGIVTRRPEGIALGAGVGALVGLEPELRLQQARARVLTPGAFARVQRGEGATFMPEAEIGVSMASEQQSLPAISVADEIARAARHRGADALATQRALAKALADTANADKEAKQAAERAARDAAGHAEAELIRRRAALEVAERQLAIAQNSNASQAEQLMMAQEIDALQVSLLQQEIARLEVEKQRKDITAGELAALTAQQDALRQQATLIQGSAGQAAALRREFEQAAIEARKAQQVTVDFGESFIEILRRARDFDSPGDLLKGVVQRGLDEFIGGLIRAEAKKNAFDLMITENFSVKLPGVFRGAASVLEEVWGGTLTRMEGDTSISTANIGNFFTTLFSRVSGQASGAANITTLLPPGFVGPPGPGQAFLPGEAGGVPVGATGAIAAGGPVGLAIAAGALALQSGLSIGARIGRDYALQQNVTAAVAATLLGGGGIGSLIVNELLGLEGTAARVSTGILTLGKSEIVRLISDLLGFEGVFGIGQIPTRGTRIKKGLSELLEEAGLPRQRFTEGGGRSGIRVPFFELPATPELAAFLGGFSNEPNLQLVGQRRPEFLPALEQIRPGIEELALGGGIFGLGAVLGAGREKDTRAIVSALTNNIIALGVSAEEARRQMLQLAESIGLDMIGGFQELNRLYLENEIEQEFLMAGVEGLVDLFRDDLPDAIDVAGFVLKNFTERGGIDIASLIRDLEVAIAALDAASSIEERIVDLRLRAMTPAQQGRELNRRLAEIDRELEDPNLDPRRRLELLQRRAELGFEIASFGSQFAPGSRAARSAMASGITIAEESAADIRELATVQNDNLDRNSTVTAENTAAVRDNTRALREAGGGNGGGEIRVIIDGGAATEREDIEAVVLTALRSPAGRAAVRDIVVTM